MTKQSKRSFLTISLFGLLTIFGCSNAQVVKIKDSAILTSSFVGKVSLLHDESGFSVVKDQKVNSVESRWVDPLLRDISKERLKSFLTFGKIVVNQMDNEEFSLKAKMLVKGGGPILAAIGYFGTKAVAYGTLIGGALGIVGATGGGAVAVAAGGEALAVTGLATAGTGTVAAAIGTSTTATTVASAATYSAVATGFATTVAAVEGWATWLGALGACIPGPL